MIEDNGDEDIDEYYDNNEEYDDDDEPPVCQWPSSAIGPNFFFLCLLLSPTGK